MGICCTQQSNIVDIRENMTSPLFTPAMSPKIYKNQQQFSDYLFKKKKVQKEVQVNHFKSIGELKYELSFLHNRRRGINIDKSRSLDTNEISRLSLASVQTMESLSQYQRGDAKHKSYQIINFDNQDIIKEDENDGNFKDS